jgi:internalin A
MNVSQPSKPERRPFQFSLRSLLLFVAVAGVFFGWLGTGLQRARKNRQAEAELHRVEAEIRSHGGSIVYENAEGPNWLEKLLGDPGVLDVQTVAIHQATDADLKHLKDLAGMSHSWELDLCRFGVNSGYLTDAGLKHLKGLTGLRNLNLIGQLKITDAGLEHLKGLTSLRALRLENTVVTPAGTRNLQEALPNARITPSSTQLAAIAEIEKVGGIVSMTNNDVLLVVTFSVPRNVTDAVMLQIKKLKDLRGRVELGLGRTQVTDAGMEDLKDLNVSSLSIGRTQVTDAGLEHLKGLSNLESLSLDFTQVTDAGLEHLEGLTELFSLSLRTTLVTDAGLEHLEGLTSLEYLHLSNTQVTDTGLEHIKRLTKLKQLYLHDTHVTDEGVRKLQEALPNCKIHPNRCR